MKKITLLLFAIFIAAFAFAQDVIVTKDGKKINSKVTEINENDIKYKNFENLDGPVYTLKKSEIATIIYANGEVDVFNMSMSTPPPQNTKNSMMNYTQKDFNDAKILRNVGAICFGGGIGLALTGSILAGTGVIYGDYDQVLAGAVLYYVGGSAALAGIIMWPVGQTRMNKIRRANPGGFTLFENENMQLNLALGGNNVGLKFRF